MATPSYMSVIGTKQGLITKDALTAQSVGNIYQEAQKDECLVQAFSHEVNIPYDPQSGQPTGKRVHRPLIITKIFDKSSPQLLQALCTGEVLTSVVIRWFRQAHGNSGGSEHYYTTKLEGAIIVQIKDYMHNCQESATSYFTHMEDVHFTYRKITWEHITANTMGFDDWGQQKTD
jgi:type VI secretion system secreted protein Hcp